MENTFEIFRTPDSLILREYVHPDKQDRSWDDVTKYGSEKTYQFQESRLGDNKKLIAKHSKVCRAWSNLASIRSWDEKVFADILLVLLETNPDCVSPEKQPPTLDISLNQRKPKKTAAHPRGIFEKQHGIKRPPGDLRPYLCHPKSIRSLLEKLAPLWSKSKQHLINQAYDARALGNLDNGKWSEMDPYLAYYFHHPGNVKALKLPSPFKQVFLPALKGNSIEEIKKALFFRYNKKFAEFLGLPLYKGNPNSEKNSYEVENILAQSWYDDWPWEKWTRK